MKIIKTAKYKKFAAKRGTFKYKCDDCQEVMYLTPREKSRAAIPRCRFCGSTWLEPVTDQAADRMQQGYDAHKKDMELKMDKANF